MNKIKWKFYQIGENIIHENAFEKLSAKLWLLSFGLMWLQVNLETWQMRQHHPTCKDKRRWICVPRQNLETYLSPALHTYKLSYIKDLCILVISNYIIQNMNTLEMCKNPRPTSGWSELTKVMHNINYEFPHGIFFMNSTK